MTSAAKVIGGLPRIAPGDLSLIKRLIEAGEVRRAVFDRWVSQYLPTPAILHPYPLERIGAKYPNIQGKNRVR